MDKENGIPFRQIFAKGRSGSISCPGGMKAGTIRVVEIFPLIANVRVFLSIQDG